MLHPETLDLSRRDYKTYSSQAAAHVCKLCVQDNASQFLVSVELNGVDESSLDLWLEDHHLTLMAEAQAAAPSFFNCIHLPSDVDEDSIQAELKNAHLEIRFKKVKANFVTVF